MLVDITSQQTISLSISRDIAEDNGYTNWQSSPIINNYLKLTISKSTNDANHLLKHIITKFLVTMTNIFNKFIQKVRFYGR